MTLRFTFWVEGGEWTTDHGKTKGTIDWRTQVCCDTFTIFISFVCECENIQGVFVSVCFCV